MGKEYGGLFKSESAGFDSKTNIKTGVSFDDFFGQQARAAKIEKISFDELVAYRGQHPFKPYSEDAMKSLVEDIRENGLLHPIVVRKLESHEFRNQYEILSGHNRAEAVKRAGLDSILCNVVDVDDNKAILIVVNSNLEQRQELLPSEKAFAYKCRLDVMKKQGKRTDLTNNDSETLSDDTSYKNCTKLNSGELLAQSEKDSRQKIYDYIRLTNLIKPLLDMVDNGALPLYAGVDISFLSADEQETVYNVLSRMATPKVTLEMSKQLKEISKSIGVTGKAAEDVFANRYGKEKKPDKVVVYSVKATKDFGKFLKRATKKRPLTQDESEQLLAVVKKATDDFIKDLED